MLTFSKTLSRLTEQYGNLPAPPPEGPFAWVMWENACYLLPDERRQEVFEELRQQVGMDAAAIAAAHDDTLLPLASRGGMRPEVRVFRWREIARLTLEQDGYNLDLLLQQPFPQAKRILMQFPNIGAPGAEKILLFCGKASGLPLESNGLRVLVRLGWARLQKSYAGMYRDVQQNIASVLPRETAALQQAFLLLREHGRKICKDKAPHCERCPLNHDCDYARHTAQTFRR